MHLAQHWYTGTETRYCILPNTGTLERYLDTEFTQHWYTKTVFRYFILPNTGILELYLDTVFVLILIHWNCIKIMPLAQHWYTRTETRYCTVFCPVQVLSRTAHTHAHTQQMSAHTVKSNTAHRAAEQLVHRWSRDHSVLPRLHGYCEGIGLRGDTQASHTMHTNPVLPHWHWSVPSSKCLIRLVP